MSNLAPLEFALGSGIHAVVGTPADGTLAIAKLVGGFEPSASGRVRVAGRDPGRDALVRGRIGATLDVPSLPAARRVHDLLAEVDSLRGTRAATDALATFGLSHWADRKVVALSTWELRALDLLLAVSTVEPLALVLTEPGADIAPIDRQALRASLSRAADAGACVIVITASMSDAIELASTIHVFERGHITRWVPVDETGALVPGRGIELRVEVDLPRLLVAALADEPGVVGIDWDEQRHRSVLSIRGADLDRLALAIARAAAAAGASVRSIAPLAPQLDEVRAAAAGLALAAYHAAYGSSYVAQRAEGGAAGTGLGPA
jgi:ABC-type multidrug transport system ATPase subunit